MSLSMNEIYGALLIIFIASILPAVGSSRSFSEGFMKFIRIFFVSFIFLVVGYFLFSLVSRFELSLKK